MDNATLKDKDKVRFKTVLLHDPALTVKLLPLDTQADKTRDFSEIGAQNQVTYLLKPRLWLASGGGDGAEDDSWNLVSTGGASFFTTLVWSIAP